MTFFPDPAEIQAQNQAVETYVNERDSWKRVLTPQHARLMSGFVRENPTVSADLAAGIAAVAPSGFLTPETLPSFQDLVARDSVAQEAKWFQILKSVTRIGFMGLESPWQESFTSGLGRTVIRTLQGENPIDAWRASSPSVGARALSGWIRGEPVNQGPGWLPGGTDATDLPGWSESVKSHWDQTGDLNQSMVAATDEVYAAYGYPIQRKYDEVAESTLINRTIDGQTYRSPYSLGRVFGVAVSKPNTIPFNVMSGLIDTGFRVSVDPIDLPLSEAILVRHAKKQVVAPGRTGAIRQAELDYLYEQGLIRDEALESGVVGEMDPRMGQRTPEIMDELDELVMGDHQKLREFNKQLDAEWDRDFYGAPRDITLDVDQIAGDTTFDDLALYGEIGMGKGPADEIVSPYGAAEADLDRLARERYGMGFDEYLYTKYGDSATQQFDSTLTHELVHAEYQFDPELYQRWVDQVEHNVMNEGMSLKEAQDAASVDFQFGNSGLSNFHPDSRAMARMQHVQETVGSLIEQKNVVRRKLGAAKDKLRRAESAKQSLNEQWQPIEDLTKADRKKAQAQIQKADQRVEDAKRAVFELDNMEADLGARLENWKEWSPERQAFEYDATYQTGLRLMADEGELAKVRKAAMREAGMMSAWRPWLKPQLMEDWLGSKQGQRIIKFLANNTSRSAQRKFLRNIPPRAQDQILEATTEAEVIARLAPFLGRELATVPSMGKLSRIATKGDNALSSLARHGWDGGIINKTRTGLHRMGAKMVVFKLDPSNYEATLDHAEAWLRTIRATDQEIDEILDMIALEHVSSGSEYANYTHVYDYITEFYAHKLAEQVKGSKYAEDIVREQMEDFTRAVLDNHEYWVDAAGNKVDDLDEVFAMVWSQAAGEKVPVPRFSAVMESQTASTGFILPNGRQIRRASSNIHLGTQRLAAGFRSQFLTDGSKADKMFDLLFPEGLRNSAFISVADGTQTVWRDMALMRVGWPMRVIPEEMLRQAAAGYGGIINHPFSYIALMMRKAMTGDIMGGTIDDILTLDALGSGHFRADPFDWNATRQSWTTVHKGGKGYNEGFARTWLQLHYDEVTRRVARYGADDTIDWLQSTDEGQEVARRVTREGRGSSRLDLTTDEGIRQYVHQQEAYLAQYTGGEWIRKNANGRWVDMYGNEITDWYSMTKAEIVERINIERTRQGLEPVTARPTSYTKDHWVALAEETTGVPAVKNVDDSQKFVVIRKGDDRALEALGTGRIGDNVIDGEIPLRSRTEFDARDLADELMAYYDEIEVATPSTVRTPRNALEKPAETYNGAINTIFEVLMAKPSSYLVRSPFFLQRYGDQMAKFYVFGDAELRRALKAWAADNGVTTMFNRQIRTQANRAGFSKVPRAAKSDEAFGARAFGVDDMEDLDRIAKSEGLRETKELFYDLAERNNIADMTRHIFPFADAWWEVLSRWAKILFGQGGQSVRTWHRMQVGVTNARKTGFFQEDEYGRETFNWPGAGLLAPWMMGNPADTNLSARVGLDQVMFIDPNARGIMVPGVGPMIQIPANMVQPALDNIPALRDAVNWFAFGDFERPEPQDLGDVVSQFMPSWARQTVAAFLSDERKNDLADEIGGVYETLLMSSNDQWGDETADQMRRTLQQAQSTGTALSWLKIVERFAFPATGQYEAEVLTPDGFWITSEALAGEYRAAREFFEDADIATEYVIKRYGLDPLNTYANTYRITDAPSTKMAYDFLTTHDELYSLTPNSMMAWITVPEGDEFFNIAYQEQMQQGQRVKLDPEQRAWLINEQKGWREWNYVREQADYLFAEIDQYTEPRSARRTAMRDTVQKWKNKRKMAIFEDYWAWDNQSRRSGSKIPERPSTIDVWDDFIRSGTPGTDAFQYTRQIDPAMSDFMVGFATRVNALRKSAPTEGMDWWLTSPSEVAVALRRGFTDWVEAELLSLPGDSRLRGEYILERYIAPVFSDYEYDEELFLVPIELPNPVVPDWFDNMPSAEVLDDRAAAQQGDVDG